MEVIEINQFKGPPARLLLTRYNKKSLNIIKTNPLITKKNDKKEINISQQETPQPAHITQHPL